LHLFLEVGASPGADPSTATCFPPLYCESLCFPFYKKEKSWLAISLRFLCQVLLSPLLYDHQQESQGEKHPQLGIRRSHGERNIAGTETSSAKDQQEFHGEKHPQLGIRRSHREKNIAGTETSSAKDQQEFMERNILS
jgi:hypothetical protein